LGAAGLPCGGACARRMEDPERGWMEMLALESEKSEACGNYTERIVWHE